MILVVNAAISIVVILFRLVLNLGHVHGPVAFLVYHGDGAEHLSILLAATSFILTMIIRSDLLLVLQARILTC